MWTRCTRCTAYFRLKSHSTPRLRKMATYQFLFPGQGSQYVGMSKRLVSPNEQPQLPAVRELYAVAERVLSYDLLSLGLMGPKASLDETVHCQPAVVVASLAGLELLKHQSPEVAAGCLATAGFSVGEIAALIFTGALKLEDGLQLIMCRAEAMHKACLETQGSMVSVIGLEHDQLMQLMRQTEALKLGTVGVANYIFPKGTVISGSLEAVSHVRDAAKEAGATVKEVSVSGAFHSPLMKSAVPKLETFLNNVEISLPKIPVYSNVTGKPFTSVEEIRVLLAEQVTKPVLWEDSIRNMIQDHPAAQFIEVGPGKQLKAMLKRIDRERFKQCTNFEV